MNPFAVELQEIRDLIERSSDAVNHQDWPAFEAMMTEDVVWERMPPTPWTLEGRVTVHSFLSGNSGKIDILYYAISGSAIDVADRTHAVARSTMSELIRNRETGLSVHVVGTYTDQFIKVGDHWLFARRTIAPRFEHDVESPTRIFERATSR
ncbi:MAG TPA: nuclear transport factor 2 family protein [Gemmatimonadaceae bacterium]